MAAARGDLDEARAELDAARAFGAANLLDHAQQMRLEAGIAARSGDLDNAQNLLWRHLDLLKGQPNERSQRATALRLFALWMIAANAPARACAPLRESRTLYAEVGGRPGGEAVSALLLESGCPAEG